MPVFADIDYWLAHWWRRKLKRRSLRRRAPLSRVTTMGIRLLGRLACCGEGARPDPYRGSNRGDRVQISSALWEFGDAAIFDFRNRRR